MDDQLFPISGKKQHIRFKEILQISMYVFICYVILSLQIRKFTQLNESTPAKNKLRKPQA